MDTLPLALYARSWPVVLAGGTEMAHAKARILAAACDRLRWIGAPEGHGVACESSGRSPEAGDFVGARIVVISTGDRAEDARLAEAARGHGALVNVVDKPEWSDFSFPALIDRGAITVAVSSAGAAPVVARWTRGLIERALPARLGALADFVAARRTRAKQALGGIAPARRFWDRVLDGEVGRAVLSGAAERAEHVFSDALAGDADAGGCTIVWASDADPGELTLNGHRALSAADRIWFSPAAAPLLDLARRDAHRAPLADAASLAPAISERVAQGKNIVLLLAGPEAAADARRLRAVLSDSAFAPVLTPRVDGQAGGAPSPGNDGARPTGPAQPSRTLLTLGPLLQ